MLKQSTVNPVAALPFRTVPSENDFLTALYAIKNASSKTGSNTLLMNIRLWITVIFVSSLSPALPQAYPFRDSFALLQNEKWYGASVHEGYKMPFKSGYRANLYGNNYGNQTAPLLLSTQGRFLWSEKPFAFEVTDQYVATSSMETIKVRAVGTNLAEAYRQASQRYFPASGDMPDSLLFISPQYNTWIELMYNQNQEDIVKYARAIVDHGLPPGVLMIDDNWAPYYGRFEFRKDRFPDAKAMIAELHALGFKVMLWVCPFVRPDSEEFRELFQSKAVLMDSRGDTSITWATAKDAAIIRWWNGYSAELDFSNPAAVTWLIERLEHLQQEYGVDGFKLDAGDMEFYPPTVLGYKKIIPNEHSELWGSFGLLFPLNEYRAMWKRGGQPLVERLRDKLHTWEDLQTLIPNMTAAGLLGYPFTCPDMIGGGDYTYFIGQNTLNPELIVRSAQCHALMPMMQFSVAPWRVLDSVHFNAVKSAVALRKKMTPYILRLAKEAARTGEPVVRSMEYVFPHAGFAASIDQFMLGDQFLVAPIVKNGNHRIVDFPKGKWKSENGEIIKGPLQKEFYVPLDRLLYFERLN